MAVKYHKGYTNIVQIHNNLIEAHYKFTREQQLILLQVAKTLQEKDIFEENKHQKVTYNLQEIQTLLNISDYRTVRGVIKSLQRCIMTYKNLEERWEADVNIFIYSKYHAGGSIDIEIHSEMLQFFKRLNEHFTKLNMKEIVSFKSQYSIRVYELCRKLQFIKSPYKQEKIYSVDEFQKMIGSTYKKWQDLENKVLSVAKNEINDNTFVYFDYEPIYSYKDGQTRGRKGVNEIKIIMNIKGHYQAKLL